MGLTDCREARLETFFGCVGVEVWDSTVMVGGHGGTLHATSSHGDLTTTPKSKKDTFESLQVGNYS